MRITSFRTSSWRTSFFLLAIAASLHFQGATSSVSADTIDAPSLSPDQTVIEGSVVVASPPPQPPPSPPPPSSGPCYTQNVVEASLAPGNYPTYTLFSPTAQSQVFAAVQGSLIYQVDMPVSADSPYLLGRDFTGVATICPVFDPLTGEYYDSVSLDMSWAENSGGAYNVLVSFIPYQPGQGSAGSPVIWQNVFLVDGGMRTDEKEKSDCMDGASEEYAPFAIDLQLTPKLYANDEPVSYGRNAYDGKWKYVLTVAGMIREINAKFTEKGGKIDLGLNSHGHKDSWYLGLSDLSGNNDQVQQLGKGAIDQVGTVYFESCCAAMGKSTNMKPNLLDSLSAALASAGKPRARVCGFNHATYSWFRDKKYHVGHTKGDKLTCSD